jgi:hypothetical protein
MKNDFNKNTANTPEMLASRDMSRTINTRPLITNITEPIISINIQAENVKKIGCRGRVELKSKIRIVPFNIKDTKSQIPTTKYTTPIV